ncbi:MAG: hypothetical protein GXO74_00415 [Calditrichaeota bacterium]|nr:hypothetical protein [Calditrichota bacterium]
MKMRHLWVSFITIVVLGLTNAAFATGNLSSITVAASDDSVGEAAIYRFYFTTGAGNDTVKGIPADGKIEFYFPAGFNVSGVEVVSSQDTNLTGGFLVPEINGQIVTVTRDSTGNEVGQGVSVAISLAMVGNATGAGSYNFAFVTKTAAGDSIDSGVYNGFVLTPAGLEHFQVDVSGNATAGQDYSIIISARDAYDNLVTSHTASVSLLDDTGTISPTESGAFVGGSVTLNVTFQKAMTANKITVTYNNKSGQSADFDVLPAALYHFVFDDISSPKIAGTPFSVNITAYDQFENQVTTFNDKVQLTDLSGSLDIESANFSSGQLLNQSVTITSSQTDNYITATHSASGKSGQSNLFNVNAGNLAKFYINPIASPQTAGEYFSITIVAQDNWDNTVTDFASKVSISDLSGTITPVESANFIGGQWTGNVKVRSAYANDQITVTKFAGSENGTSTVFDVAAGALDHFSISAIATPQQAGQAFGVTIQALDTENNLVESFTGKVDVADLTNTVSPTQTENFTNGQWSGTITITKAIASDKLFVSDSEKSGESNSFEVAAADLDHFTFETIGAQEAGVNFSVTVHAHDAFGNVVSSFNDDVTLSDKTGTLSPTSLTLAGGTGSENVAIFQSGQDNLITATHAASGKTGNANFFNVAPSAVHQIVIRDNPGGLGVEVGDLNFNLHDQLRLYAAGYDQWGNYVREVTADWSADGNLDAPSPALGNSTLFQAETPLSSGKIRADSIGLVADLTGTFTVASIATIKILDQPDGLGNEVTDLNTTTDDTLKLYAAGFDAADHFVGTVVVDWSSDGALSPAVTGSDTMFAFDADLSGVSGHILAAYNDSLHATTGTITVSPGAPYGEMELHPNPAIIAAHPDSFSMILSDKITDRDGNYVGAGKYFIVTTTAGTITTPDEKPDLDGHWIATNSYSRLYFQLNGSSEGGAALVSAHSAGEGSAFGDTLVIISGLDIVSIEAGAEKATQGQKKIPVNMVVQNRGTLDISVDAAGLEFWGPAPTYSLLTNKFTIARTDTISKIIAQTQETISFEIDVLADTPAEPITIDGYVVGTLNGETVRDDSASTVDQILVQIAPNLILENISVYVDTVIQGTSTTVSATVRNTGDAPALIQTDSLFFWAVGNNFDVTDEYGQISFPSNVEKIDGHSVATLNYTVAAGTNATIDTIALSGEIVATDENSGDAVNFQSFEPEYDGWWVRQASDVEIVDFKASQFTVTRGQTEDWFLQMVVENRGGIDLLLDSVVVNFTLGGQAISDEYRVSKPVSFLHSGDDTLRTGATDTLTVTVDTTGTSLGIVTVEGTVFLNDKISGQIVKSTATGVTVQSEAEISINFIHLSQNEVTVGQTQPWTITLGITNNGGGDIAMDSTRLGEFVAFGNDTNYRVTAPVHFAGSADFVLGSSDSDSLIFTVDTTGTKPGTRNVFAHVFAREINSHRLVQALDTTKLIVELPPAVKILSVKNMAANAPFVDTDRQFPVSVILENIGEDAAQKVFLSLTSDSVSTVLVPNQTAQRIKSGERDTVNFDVRAFSGKIVDEIFTATIDSLVAENTPEKDKATILPADDSTAVATVQLPAIAKVESVYVSADTVKALSRTIWYLYLDVINSGEGGLVFDKPQKTDVQFYIDGEIQEDYSLIPPDNLENNGLLSLNGGEKDQFAFRISKTGFKGGSVTIKVNLFGKYKNTVSDFSLTDSTHIYVIPSADIYVDVTEPMCPNIDAFGVGHLNVGQEFLVRAKIRNSGAEQVDSVIVKISTDAPGYSDQTTTIQFIEPGGDSTATFHLTADEVRDQVIFSATIVSAEAHESQLPAIIGAASDSTALVKVHNAANMKINVISYESVFTGGQNGQLKLMVSNVGSADVDESGKLYIRVSPGYGIVKGQTTVAVDTTGFVVGGELNWEIQPPAEASENDTIKIVLFKPPRDKNTQLPAQVQNPFENLIVKTVPSNIQVETFQIISPAGALDDTLSTEQNFTVKLKAKVSENLDSVRASLSLPPGFGFLIGEDSTKSLPGNSVQWQVIAPIAATTQQEWIKATIVGKTDGRSDAFVDSFAVTVVPHAILVFDDIWVSWPSQTQSTLSAGQEFDLSVMVKSKNPNQARVTGSAALRVNFGSTGITTTESLIKNFSVDSPVVWRLKAPDVETGKRPLTIFMEAVPSDENTNSLAELWSGQSRLDFYVETVASANVEVADFTIVSPSGATDKVLSTRQNFLVQAQLDWQNCRTNPTVTLQLPEGFTTSETNPKQPESQTEQGIVSWTIRAPEVGGQNLPLWLNIQATDANSGAPISLASDSIEVDVVDRAEIQLNGVILFPPSAQDNIVSPGEEFTISTYLTFSGQAQAIGNYTATLTLPQNREYTITGSRTKTVKADQSIEWKIRAPITKQDPANILIELTAPPDDENTNEPVALEAISAKVVAIPITTEEKSVTISVLPQSGANTQARGGKNVVLLRLKFDVSGDALSNNVIFSGVKLKLKNRFDELIENPSAVLTRLAAVDGEDHQRVFVNLTNVPSLNPIVLNFSNPDSLKSGEENIIDFVADIAGNAAVGDFHLAIDSTKAMTMYIAGSGIKPIIQTDAGEAGEALNLASQSTVLVDADLKKSFSNYPNPFGSATRPETKFVYFLPQNTRVSIQIYTLTGDLVWKVNYSEAQPQGQQRLHNGDIIWDGRNGNGKRVLNGIYVARISTGDGKEAITKIAVVK